MVEKAKELEFEVEPKDVTEVLQSHETLKDEELLLTEQRGFLTWNLLLVKMMRRLLK